MKYCFSLILFFLNNYCAQKLLAAIIDPRTCLKLVRMSVRLV